MWISILTKHCQLSQRMRHNIERHVGRALRHQKRHIGSVVVTIRPTRIGGEPVFRCRLRIWSHYLGTIVVNDVGDTVRTTTQQATARVRQVIRRRLEKRLSGFRRLKRGRLPVAE